MAPGSPEGKSKTLKVLCFLYLFWGNWSTWSPLCTKVLQAVCAQICLYCILIVIIKYQMASILLYCVISVHNLQRCNNCKSAWCDLYTPNRPHFFLHVLQLPFTTPTGTRILQLFSSNSSSFPSNCPPNLPSISLTPILTPFITCANPSPLFPCQFYSRLSHPWLPLPG